MKKILSIILVLACVFAMFSCGEVGDIMNKVDSIFNAVAPTKIVTETTESFDGKLTLVSKSTLKSGKVDGFAAATYEYVNQKLLSVEAGAGDTELLPWEEVSGLLEYHDDKGLRVDGGKWDVDGENFAPTAGEMAPKFSEKNVKDVKEDKANNTITFVVPAAKTAAVFGEDGAPNADVFVTLTHDGAAVTSITLNYKVEAEKKNQPDIEVTVKVLYSYEAEQITIK
jgi:hypothetical protein